MCARLLCSRSRSLRSQSLQNAGKAALARSKSLSARLMEGLSLRAEPLPFRPLSTGLSALAIAAGDVALIVDDDAPVAEFPVLRAALLDTRIDAPTVEPLAATAAAPEGD